MTLLKRYWIVLVLILIISLFFNKVFTKGFVPFPGDLLMGNYEPYKSTISGVPHKGQGADVIRELYPWKQFSVEEIKRSSFPLWDPYVFSGTPHFASLQSGTLYPVNVLFFVLPFVDAWTIYIILQYVFLFTFSYLYLRTIGLQKLSALFGAISFSFCSFLSVWGEYGNFGHSLAFLPLALLSIEKILKQKKWYWYVFLIASFVLSTFAGYIQFTLYMYLFSGFYVAAKFFTEKKRSISVYFSIVLCFVAGLLVSAVQLLPVFELVSLSLRSNYSYTDLTERLLPIESLVTLIVPDFFGNPATGNYFLKGGSILERAMYIGFWPILFAILSLFTKRTFYKMFFLFAALLSFVSCLSLPPVAYVHSIGIPFLSTGIPTRILALFSFCVSVLAAIGFNYFFFESKKKKKLIIVVTCFCAALALLWAATFIVNNPNLLISRRNLLLPTVIFVTGAFFLLIKFPKKLTASVVIFLTVIDLFYSFQKFNSFVPKSFVYPKTTIVAELQKTQGINRSWGYGNAYIDANFPLVDKNYSTEGYDALFSKRYGEFLSASENGKVPSLVPKSVANVFKGYGVNELKENPYRERALNLSGVSILLNKKEDRGIDSAFDEKKYKLTWEENGWQIYTSVNVLPRAYLFGSYKKVSNSSDIIKTLYSKNFNYKKTVILESKISGYTIKQDNLAKVKIVSYEPNRVVLQTSSKHDQIVFLSDNYFPGWKAYVNGVQTPIYRANYTFRAVPVKAGENTVIFTYSPLSFWVGFWVSLTSAVGIAVFVFILKKYDKKT